MNYVIFNADGSLNKQNFEFYVQQGDNNNQFFVSLAGGLASDSAIGVCVLPNGETNTISGVWNANYEYAEGETADGWLFSLTTAQTEYNGLLQIAIYVNRGSTIKVSYPIGIVVNETGVRPYTDTGITIEELNSYLVELQKYALKDHVIYLEERLSTDPLSLIGNGPHFIKVNGVYYFFTISGSGTVNFSAINLSNPKNYYHGSVVDTTTIADALSSLYLDELVDKTSNQYISGKKSFTEDISVDGGIKTHSVESYEDDLDITALDSLKLQSGSGTYVVGAFGYYDSSYHWIDMPHIEYTTNKVTSLSSSSTDTQYPSAKCVYDGIQNIREVAEGKCKTFILSYGDTITSLKQWITDHSYLPATAGKVYLYTGAKQLEKQTPTDITSAVSNGDYDSAIITNSSFNSQNDSVTIQTPTAQAQTTTYLIVELPNEGYHPIKALIAFYFTQNVVFTQKGDVFLITETDVPDRWSNGSATFYKLETSKIDLSSYVDLTSAQTITGTKSFSNILYFLDTSYADNNWRIHADNQFNLYIGRNGSDQFLFQSAQFSPATYQEVSINLGSNNYKWKDLYLGGTAYIPTIQLENHQNNNLSSTATYVQLRAQGGIALRAGGLYVRPGSDGTTDLGTSSYKWGNAYIAGNLTDGTNSYTIAESMAQFNPTDTGTTEIKWSQMLVFDLSSDTTFTFETAKTGCLSEYKAIISNNGNSSITLTFTSVTNILCNDDNCVVTNGTNSTLVLPTGVSIEVSVIDGMMVAVNFEA